MPKDSGKTGDLSRRPTKYDTMRTRMIGKKKSKTTWSTLTVSRETIEDCISSWLTATGMIDKDQFVTAVIADKASVLYPEDIEKYTVRLERLNAKEEA